MKYGLILTVLLGAAFTCVQAFEYAHAAFAFTGNIYGATFFMATGFHGFHVLVGTIFLLVCLFRVYAGHFTPTQHLGFEFAAWYWHFVDVVWLFLFVCIYVWGYGGRGHGDGAATDLQGHSSRATERAAREGRPFSSMALWSTLSTRETGRTDHDRLIAAPPLGQTRHARPRLQMPALRQGQALCGLPQPARRAAKRAGSTMLSSTPAMARRSSSSCWPVPSWSAAALVVEIKYQPPFWLHAALWLPLILATTLLPLRSMKSLLIALQFHHKAAPAG